MPKPKGKWLHKGAERGLKTMAKYTKKQKSNFNVQEMITEKLIAGLEEGRIPWNRPWNQAALNAKKADSEYYAVNHMTGRPYNGLNVLLLDAGEYITFNNIKKKEYSLMKGAKSEIAVFWTFIERDKEVTKKDGSKETKKVKIPYLKYYRVFNIENVYLDKECTDPVNPRYFGYVDPEAEKMPELSLDLKQERYDAALHNYISKYNIPYTEQGDRAYYVPSMDSITLPPKNTFKTAIGYLQTKAHEAGHSTGHSSRLDRAEGMGSYGKQEYSKEELTAEITAAMLGANFVGMENIPMNNIKAYINGWVSYLKDNKREIVSAMSRATKATELIMAATEDTEAAEQSPSVAVKNLPAPASTVKENKGKNWMPFDKVHLGWNWCVNKVAELRAAGELCDIYSIVYENGKKFAKIKCYEVAESMVK